MSGKMFLLLVGVLVAPVSALSLETQDPLESLRAELVPAPGTETSYGIPLYLENAQTFADWFYTVQLSPEERALFEKVLSEIPAPCCDDNPVLKCCCRRTNRICNLTRSAMGLAAWLIHVKGLDEADLRDAVEEWLRFLVPNYYLAVALEERGLDPAAYGLGPHEAYESCDARRCEAPLDAGGCGGMGLEVILQAAGKVPACCRAEDR